MLDKGMSYDFHTCACSNVLFKIDNLGGGGGRVSYSMDCALARGVSPMCSG